MYWLKWCLTRTTITIITLQGHFTESVVDANREYESKSWRECQCQLLCSINLHRPPIFNADWLNPLWTLSDVALGLHLSWTSIKTSILLTLTFASFLRTHTHTRRWHELKWVTDDDVTTSWRRRREDVVTTTTTSTSWRRPDDVVTTTLTSTWRRRRRRRDVVTTTSWRHDVVTTTSWRRRDDDVVVVVVAFLSPNEQCQSTEGREHIHSVHRDIVQYSGQCLSEYSWVIMCLM